MGVGGTYRKHLILGTEGGEGTQMAHTLGAGPAWTKITAGGWPKAPPGSKATVTVRLLQLLAHFQADNELLNSQGDRNGLEQPKQPLKRKNLAPRGPPAPA